MIRQFYSMAVLHRGVRLKAEGNPDSIENAKPVVSIVEPSKLDAEDRSWDG